MQLNLFSSFLLSVDNLWPKEVLSSVMSLCFIHPLHWALTNLHIGLSQTSVIWKQQKVQVCGQSWQKLFLIGSGEKVFLSCINISLRNSSDNIKGKAGIQEFRWRMSEKRRKEKETKERKMRTMGRNDNVEEMHERDSSFSLIHWF